MGPTVNCSKKGRRPWSFGEITRFIVLRGNDGEELSNIPAEDAKRFCTYMPLSAAFRCFILPSKSQSTVNRHNVLCGAICVQWSGVFECMLSQVPGFGVYGGVRCSGGVRSKRGGGLKREGGGGGGTQKHKVCAPKKPKSTFPFVKFVFPKRNPGPRERGGVSPPPPTRPKWRH